MKKKKEKIIFILTIILGTLIIFVLLWLFLKGEQRDNVNYIKEKTTSQGKENLQDSGVNITEPIKNWKICKNIKAKYQMRYPSEWEMGVRGSYGFEPREECNIENMNFGKYDEYLSADYYIKITSLSMEDAGDVYKDCNSLEEYFDKRPGIIKNYPIIETFTLENEKAVYLEKSPNPRVYTFHNKRIFNIIGKNISQQTFDEFLLTFEFLD